MFKKIIVLSIIVMGWLIVNTLARRPTSPGHSPGIGN